jgi:type II secretory pathway component GspD/PulD (secretin)
MSRTGTSGIVFALVVACSVGADLYGQDKGARTDDEIKHLVVPLRGSSGKELATLLNKQFAGQAEAELLPDLNVLVIRAKGAVVPEIGKVLLQYDRPARSVRVEVLVVDLPPQEKVPDDSEFTGAARDVTARLDALRKSGKVSAVKRVEMTALENQQSRVIVGESKPFVVGTNRTGTGITTSTVTYRNLGLNVKVTPRLSQEGVLTIELDADEARAVQAEDGPVLGQDEKGQPIRATTFTNNQVNSRLIVPNEQMVVAKSIKTTGKAGEGRTLVLVTATLVGGK